MSKVYEFGPFRLDPLKRLLLRGGRPVQITPKAFDTLLILVERGGRVIDKNELLELLWPDTVVEEINLNVQISTLRKALGEVANDHKYIVTVPRRGYTFVAEVRETDPVSAPVAAPSSDEPEMLLDAPKEEQPGEKVDSSAASARAGKRRAYIAAAILILLSSALLSLAWLSERARRHASDVKGRSIAVLPFKPLNPEGEEYLGIGMADAIIARLSNIKEISVRSTNAVFPYVGREYDSVAAGRQLEVDLVMEGTVLREGGRVRVTVQLINVADGKPVWADKFDERLVNLLAVQDSISEQVTGALSLRIDRESKRLMARRDTENIEAYDAYMRGLYFWSRRFQGGLEKAVEYFEKAVEKDPSYALAYAMLADSFAIKANYMPNRESARDTTFEKARAAALKAVELDEATAEAHMALALIIDMKENDSAGAEDEYKRALELNPAHPTTYIRYGWFLAKRGQVEHALVQMRQAVRLDPASLVPNIALAQLLYWTERFDEAVAQSQKVLELDPTYKTARLTLAQAYEGKGKYGEALEEAMKASEGPEDIETLGILGHINAVTGRRDEALLVIEQLQDLVKADGLALYYVGVVYEGLGQSEKALDWIEKAADAGVINNLGLRIDPRLAALRQHPRYAAIRDRWLTPVN